MKTRRTKANIEQLKASLYAIIEEMRPMTVRQIFYQAVSRGLIGKSEAEYKQTIVRLLTDMRKKGELPWYWIADNTRWMRKPNTHDSLESMLDEAQELYRRALWRDQDDYVEIWLEKDALSGVLYDVTSKWDVPLMVTRGYPSFSFLANAAEAIRAKAKPTYLYYFGDHDPSGVDIPRHIEQQLGVLINPLRSDETARNAVIEALERNNISVSSDLDEIMDGYAGLTTIRFESVAITEDQIIDLDLQTRPTKKKDPRAKHFKGESVEVDAIHPDTLRGMVEDCITKHIDTAVLKNTQQIEQAERETLGKFRGEL